MSQQINLYNPALRQPREWLTAANLAIGIAALLVLVSLSMVATRYRLAQANAEAAAAAEQLAGMQAQLALVNSQLIAHKANGELAQKIDIARSQLRSREETLTALADISIEPGKGFAGYMHGFSRQAMSGAWLTGVSIGPGKELSIHGRALNQALISEYVNRLGNEPAFKGHTFAQVNMAPVVDKTEKTPPAAAPANAGESKPIEFNLIASPGSEAANGRALVDSAMPVPQLQGNGGKS